MSDSPMEEDTPGVIVPLEREGIEAVVVNLVKPRHADDRAIVSSRQTDRVDADDLVALATQLTTARDLVKGRACDRLRSIAHQMEQLQVAARKVLEDAARDEDLHKVACNMAKQPGRVYHLYRRDDGYRYFSLLSPIEWGKDGKSEEYMASYRLEFDRSWTPMSEAADRDNQYHKFEHLLKGGPSMLGWS